jgi:N-acetyl sugar amidotransferase
VTQPYRICTRCIMDTTDPEIAFDAAGLCNHCRGFFDRLSTEVFRGELGRARLTSLVQRIKADGRRNEYDCVIGVSGGVDSTYVAYLVKQHGLRPLAVHFDNGWDSELAVANIKCVLDRLEIDLYTHVVDWEEFKDLQLAFLRASIPNAEIPTDHAIGALLYQVAARRGLRYIITGSNVATEAILPFAWGYYNNDYRHLRAIHKRFGGRPLKTMPRLRLMEYAYFILVRGIRLIRILNYVDYSKPRAVQVLEDALGWRSYGAKHFESIYTRFFQGYILPRKFGYDKRRAHLSCMVCMRDITRAEALTEMERDPYAGYNLEEDRAFVMKKLGLSANDLNAILDAPPKSYRDYASNANFLHRLPHVKRVLRRLATDL